MTRRATLVGALAAAALLALGPTPGRLRAQSPAPDGVRMIALEGEAASYWPRWRGPSGQGIAPGSGYPDRWSASENVLWKAKIPGRGHSSPIVWGDRLFVTTGYEDGRVSVLAYRVSDGAPLWETFSPDRTPERMHPKNSPASPTPTTDGTRVFASFGNKGVLAVDFAGKVLWHRSLGTFDNYHGTAGSPLLYQNRLILFQDHGGGAFVTALDGATGQTVWRTARKGSVGWGTPVALRVHDHDELIVSSQGRVDAYEPATGKELWHCGGNLFEVIPTPVVGHGLLYCSSGRAGPTLAIRPGGSGDVSKTHVEWQSPRGSPFVPSPILYGDNLYLVNDMTSVATSLDAKSGKVVWQERLGAAMREGFSASPVIADGKIFFTNDLGETFVVRAASTFELLHVNRLDAPTLASPALVGGRWYFRTEHELIAIGRRG